MKNLKTPIAATLAALMLLTFFAPAAAVARESFAGQDGVFEADRGRSFGFAPDRRPPPPRPAPPPPPRRDDHRDRDRRRGSVAGSLIAGAIGGLIAGAIANSRNGEAEVYYVEPAPEVYYVEPAPEVYYVEPSPPIIIQPAPQPVLVCDQFGNCWYEYPR